ncbi:tRNA (adenosine(37)-N6)-threonylcarbamoyltransferase complex transferase subunit TsaD [Candidatus Dojkabacteria bacterium]|nr:tRNA (adenosine(37)-N6)-threonylcarbamoyltransferase complex transferase subunit TsaD [Candidatus Dojkabacteria bacterium]
MTILAIDTSCDETAAAVIRNNRVISNVISSQVELHKKWGGVVPDIARRAHAERIDAVVNEALKRSRVKLDDIDYFAVTYGPGLAIALEIGVKKAKEMALKQNKPLVSVDHMEGHLLSSFAKNSLGRNPKGPTLTDLPAMGLLVSGGHTELVLMKDFGDYKIVGETLDDAAGEAFDKVAKMLNLGYPGGPIVTEFAEKGTPGSFDLPIPMENSGDLNFSFSGLKTACLYKIKDLKKSGKFKDQKLWIHNFCADFQNSVIKSLVIKLQQAIAEYKVKSVFLGGGVIANVPLRRAVRSAMKKSRVKVYQPYSPKLFGDNAAMIGVCAYYQIKRNDNMVLHDKNRIRELDRDPVLQIRTKD